jgi:hypothetical protein
MSEKKPFFHRLSMKKKKELFASKMTVGELMKQYRQPTWCGYPEALGGAMGCWSLVSATINVSKQFCITCDCAKHYDEEEAKRRGK